MGWYQKCDHASVWEKMIGEFEVCTCRHPRNAADPSLKDPRSASHCHKVTRLYVVTDQWIRLGWYCTVDLIRAKCGVFWCPWNLVRLAPIVICCCISWFVR